MDNRSSKADFKQLLLEAYVLLNLYIVIWKLFEPFEFGPWNIKQWSASCDKLTKGWTFFSDELLNNKVNFLNGPFDENLVNNIINEWIDQIESSILEESEAHSDATSFEKWKGSVDYLFSQLSFVRKSN